MVDALRCVDGVGLARPVCTEPRLSSSILGGEISSCIQPLLNELDFGVAVMLAGAQIRLISMDREPIDTSDSKAVEGFTKDLRERMSGGGRKVGHVDIKSQKNVPYGKVLSS